jgi:hypothetical protein
VAEDLRERQQNPAGAAADFEGAKFREIGAGRPAAEFALEGAQDVGGGGEELFPGFSDTNMIPMLELRNREMPVTETAMFTDSFCASTCSAVRW